MQKLLIDLYFLTELFNIKRGAMRRLREFVTNIAREVADERIKHFLDKRDYPEFKVHILPGGKMPVRATDGAVGFDAFLRAVVSPHEMDPNNKILRKSLFNFKDIPKDNPFEERHVVLAPTENQGTNGNELVYLMEPGQSVLVGIGLVVEMEFPYFHWVAPRSGLAAKWGITVTNAPGTVDPDYRGEAGVLVLNNNRQPFQLKKDMKIAQAVFQRAVIPKLIEVASYKELSQTVRGTGGFGSTGIR